MGLIPGNHAGDEPQYIVCKQVLVISEMCTHISFRSNQNSFNIGSSYGNCFKIFKQHKIGKSLQCISYCWLDTTVIYTCFHEKSGFQHEYMNVCKISDTFL